ncbi:MAG: hypothetical protein HY903_04855 [Deltaproteobacteria bacterium]|nr:hypothetical protein [Deltaproteobacteria bacterium]
MRTRLGVGVAGGLGSVLVIVVAFACGGSTVASSVPAGLTEICDNHIDDDSDGVVDCVDVDCRDLVLCQGVVEDCSDGLDNDLDGLPDCADPDCAVNPLCSEDCGNGLDDNGDTLVDCADPVCKGIDPRCGEVCGDGLDNDQDGVFDCQDSDCFAVIPPCGGGVGPDGTMCAYGGVTPHVCQCADGGDNDADGLADALDLKCFGPFDDDESDYATGIPGDNKGSKGSTECPFDGNSGVGNDWVCCNPADPTQNVTPNGCDNVGCCEVDLNGNGTGEHAIIGGSCSFAPPCGAAGTDGCPCGAPGECDPGQFCVPDDDSGAGFCSTCEGCTPSAACENPCGCGETCFGGFEQPASVCGGGGVTPSCPSGATACPNGNSDCDAAANEQCTNGCCFATCPGGVTPCQVWSDCPTDFAYVCITGCCIISA